MRFQKTTALMAAAILAGGVGLSACSSDSGSSDGINYVTVNGSEPQNPLVPSNTNENGGGRIVDRLWAGLRRIDVKGKIYDEVASSIETTDNKSYTIKLKPDWKFSDGTPVTAKSFVDAWNYGALATNAQLQSYVYTPIVGFEDVQSDPPKAQSMSGLKVVSDSEFTVELTAANIDFKSALAYAPFYPLPEAAFKDMKAYGEHPIGNGPYKLIDGNAWDHNVELKMVPNPDYTGGRPAKNDGLNFKFYQSFDTAYADLQAGNLDALDTIPPSAIGTYKQDLGDHALTAPTAQNQHIGIQQHAPHFGGPEGVLRRKAISMAINREQISENVFKGLRKPAKDFTSESLPGFNGNLPGVEALSYNPDEAKKLWAQADAIAPWSGKFEIAYNTDGGHQEWIDAVANSIKNTLGIDAVGAPAPTFKQIRDQIVSHQINTAFRYGWQGDYPTMLQFLTPQYLSTSDTNDVEFKNPEFDEKLNASLAAPTDEESWKLVGEAQAVLLREMADIPVFDYINAGGTSTNVTNGEISWAGLFDFENITK